MVLKELIGKIIYSWEAVVVLKELIINIFYCGRVCVLKELIFNSFNFGKVWWS